MGTAGKARSPSHPASPGAMLPSLMAFWVVLHFEGSFASLYPTAGILLSSRLQNTGAVQLKRAWVSPYKWPNRYLTAEFRRNNHLICMSLGLGASLSMPSANSLMSTCLPQGLVRAVQSSLPRGYSLANPQHVNSHQIMG